MKMNVLAMRWTAGMKQGAAAEVTSQQATSMEKEEASAEGWKLEATGSGTVHVILEANTSVCQAARTVVVVREAVDELAEKIVEAVQAVWGAAQMTSWEADDAFLQTEQTAFEAAQTVFAAAPKGLEAAKTASKEEREILAAAKPVVEAIVAVLAA
eukprot:5056749-Pleurochrysis_carterae.AAC.1